MANKLLINYVLENLLSTYLSRWMGVWCEAGFPCLANFNGFFSSFSVLCFSLCVIST